MLYYLIGIRRVHPYFFPSAPRRAAQRIIHCYDMKRIIYTVLAATLLSCAFLFVSCGEKDEIGRQTLEYLEQKYEKDTFTVSEVPKTKSVTGRYELAVKSDDDGVDFDVYIYAFFITDSYSVTKANIRAGEKVREMLEPETLEGIKEITVYPVYDDGGTDYRFTSLPIDGGDALTEISSISLKDTDDTSEAAKEIDGIVRQLKRSGVSLEKVCFSFGTAGYTVYIDTNSEYVLSLDGEQLNELVVKSVEAAVSKAKEGENIFADRSVKVELNEGGTEATEADERSADDAKR